MLGSKVTVCAAMVVTTRHLHVESTHSLHQCHADCAFISSTQPRNVVFMTRVESSDPPVDQQVVLVFAHLVAHPVGLLASPEISD